MQAKHNVRDTPSWRIGKAAGGRDNVSVIHEERQLSAHHHVALTGIGESFEESGEKHRVDDRSLASLADNPREMEASTASSRTDFGLERVETKDLGGNCAELEPHHAVSEEERKVNNATLEELTPASPKYNGGQKREMVESPSQGANQDVPFDENASQSGGAASHEIEIGNLHDKLAVADIAETDSSSDEDSVILSTNDASSTPHEQTSGEPSSQDHEVRPVSNVEVADPGVDFLPNVFDTGDGTGSGHDKGSELNGKLALQDRDVIASYEALPGPTAKAGRQANSRPRRVGRIGSMGNVTDMPPREQQVVTTTCGSWWPFGGQR